MRKILIALLSILLVGSSFFIAQKIIASKKRKKPKSEKIVQSVYIDEVKNTVVPITIVESGRLVAKQKVELYSEVQGVMEPTVKEFKPGAAYTKGEILVQIRNSDYYANLQAQKSTLQNLITSVLPDLRLDYPEAYPKWNNYIRDFNMDKPVQKLPKVSSDKEKFFITGKNIYTTYYKTKNMEIVLQKYTLRAPFNGILTDALVTPGTVVRPGQKLGEFINPNEYELEVSIKKENLASLKIGQPVIVKSPSLTGQTWEGKIIRINGKVDIGTQTVKVYVQVRDKTLREGMYMEANIKGNPIDNAVEVPNGLLINGNQLYIVKNDVLKLVPVTILYKKHDTVVVSGLQNGMLLVSKPIAGAYEGMKVVQAE